MNTDTKNHDITVGINVDTSGLEKAVALMERLAVAAERACDAIVTFNGAAVVADDVVTCELQADNTQEQILCELRAWRKELAEQRTFVESSFEMRLDVDDLTKS